MAELALDHDQRHAFVRHFYSVSVAELVRREPPSHTRRTCGMVQSLARGRRLPAASGGRSVDHA